MDARRLLKILKAVGADDELDTAIYPLRVCAAAVELLGVTGAGVTLMAKSHLGAVWASDPLAQTAEDVQFSLGEGPALDAHFLGSPSMEPELAETSGRWPFFSPKVYEMGVRAVFSFPLQVGVIHLGALNLIRTESGMLAAGRLADALILADVATMHLIDLQAEGSLHWPMSDRFAERARVHQATGMVAAQIGSDMTTALARLRGHAFASDVDLFQVAEEVIARRLRLADQPDH